MLIEIGKKAKKASRELGMASTTLKNEALRNIANSVKEHQEEILLKNQKDIDIAKSNGISGALLDRLTLNEERIDGMIEGILQIEQLEDPVGEMLSMKLRPNGIKIGQKRVPIGVIGIIYEARPNVTLDAAALCLKASNVVILRGGKEAINSNIAIVEAIREGLEKTNLPQDCVQLITETSREVATEFMRLNEYLDLLIPRGGAGLIQSVIKNATVPVIETGVGNCHIFVDETADLEMALKILINGKTQRPGVCNATESVLVHEKVARDFIPMVESFAKEYNVEIRGDKRSRALVKSFKEADEKDWSTEYLDLILSLKIVDSLEEAMDHIDEYGTRHSEAIITSSYENSQLFLDRVDAAAVYVNASTRFTDGFEFGFGGEIGISTQKLHARGPMGLKELTTTKYVIYGNGQVR